MATPFTQGSKKIIDGLVFRPKIAEEFARIAWKNNALLRDEFVNRRMSPANVFLGS